MKLSFSISPAWRVLNLSESEILSRHRACGFRYLCDELTSPIPEGSASRLAKENLKIMNDAGITPVKVRAENNANLESLYRAMEYAASLNVRKLVVPLIADERWTRAEYTKANADYLRTLSVAARQNGITLLIEHAGDYQLPHYSQSSMELNRLLEIVSDADNIAVNLNIANVGLTDLDMYPEIRLLGKRILSADASDHFFAMALGHEKERENLGLAPLMGFLDYDEIMRGLKETDSAEELNLRLNYPRVFDKKSPFVDDPKLDRFPLPLLERFTIWTRHVCEYMMDSYGIPAEKEDFQ